MHDYLSKIKSLQSKIEIALKESDFEKLALLSTDLETSVEILVGDDSYKNNTTHQDLDKKVEKGEFRADLFYRINVFPIEVPNLASRTVDVPILVKGIIEKIKFSGQEINVSFSEDALKVLSNYSWPGNVRELRNVIERASVLFNDKLVSGNNVKENLLRLKVPDPDEEQDELWAASTDLVEVDDKKEDNETLNLPIPKPEQYKDWFLYFDKMDLRRHLSEIEIVMIEAALLKTDGMVSQASDALKLRRTTLIEKMKKYGISNKI